MPTPGRVFSEYKSVRGGSNEYTIVAVVDEGNSAETKNGVLGTHDSIVMVFDNDLILDDITIRNPSNVTFAVTLIYSTGNSIELSGYTTDFSINKPGDSSNIWYRAPAWSKLQISIGPSSGDGILQVSAIGRA